MKSSEPALQPDDSPAYRLPRLPTLRLRAVLRSRGRARLPPFKGSTLRGAFGHALKKSVCSMGPEQPCESCLLRTACVYTRIFETFVDPPPPPLLAGIKTAPRPYVFDPRTAREDFAAGDPLELDLLLIGRAAELQAFAVLALERMAVRGLGARRHPFELETVSVPDQGGGGSVGYEKGERRWRRAAQARPPEEEAVPPGRAVLRFLTPTQLAVRGKLQKTFSFRLFAAKAIRRHLELAHFYVPESGPDWRFRPLLEKAEGVRVVEEKLEWRGFDRYSNRQGRKNRVEGFTGEVTLEGNLDPFVRMLRTAEEIHVGKKTTFGLGKMRVEEEPATHARPA